MNLQPRTLIFLGSPAATAPAGAARLAAPSAPSLPQQLAKLMPNTGDEPSDAPPKESDKAQKVLAVGLSDPAKDSNQVMITTKNTQAKSCLPGGRTGRGSQAAANSQLCKSGPVKTDLRPLPRDSPDPAVAPAARAIKRRRMRNSPSLQDGSCCESS